MARSIRALLVVSALVLVASSVAGAADTTSTSSSSTAQSGAGEREWTQVTDATDGRNTDEVGLVRTPDGVLHVFWRARVGANQEVVRHTPISPTGDVGSTVTAAGPVASAGNPVAILDGSGLRVFFAGLTGSESSLDGVLSASSDAKGVTWSPTVKVSSTSSAIPEGVGAGVAPDGTPAFAYAYSFVLGYHLGLDPATADVDLIPGNDCCAYGPNIAFTDTEGVVGWYSNVAGAEGWRTQTVSPQVATATPAPDPLRVGKWTTPSQRTALVTRTGTDEIYLAYCAGYPTCESVLLWQVGTPTADVVAKGPDIEHVNLASDDEGQLWLVYADGRSGTLYATRSDEDATAFVGVATFDPPADADTVWRLAGSATDDHLDVVASLTTDDGINAWHTAVLPGLAVEPEVGKKATTFAVTDSDGPVKGATVTYRGKRATTNGQGVAVVRVATKATTAPREATVVKSGYTTATATPEVG